MVRSKRKISRKMNTRRKNTRRKNTRKNIEKKTRIGKLQEGGCFSCLISG
jgi:hypothetical protein